MREGDAARGEKRVDKSLKEYEEFRAAMKQTIDEPGKDQVVKKVEKKDKGKEKAVESDEEVEADDDDSAWLSKRRKDALEVGESASDAPKSQVCPTEPVIKQALMRSTRKQNNSSSRLAAYSSVI
jgi:hypothetical protein